MNRFLISSVLLLSLSACLHAPADKAVHEAKAPATSIAAFSVDPEGDLPTQWEPLVIHRTKKPTRYKLVSEHGKTILHATAASASSGLMQRVNIDPLKQSWLSWDWKIANLIPSADNYERHAEDSPARIILGFDGDKDNLPFADQLLFETARIVTGHDFPYATLMYVWENKAPVGTIIPSTRTSRIKMVVVASGPEGVGKWRSFNRNIAEDFERAFGEKPGKLIGVGVMTDTDNTGETVEAWYGDIKLREERRQVASQK